MKIIQYIQDSKAEMKHVVWPHRALVIQFTIAIVLISVFLAVYLGAFDYLFTKAIEFIIAN
jgi:preprotein translocase subunit SecE